MRTGTGVCHRPPLHDSICVADNNVEVTAMGVLMSFAGDRFISIASPPKKKAQNINKTTAISFKIVSITFLTLYYTYDYHHKR